MPTSGRLAAVAAGVAAGVVIFGGWQTVQAQSGATAGARVVALDINRVFNGYQRQIDFSNEMLQFQAEMEGQRNARRQAIEMKQTTLQQLDPNDPTFRNSRRDLLRMTSQYRLWDEMVRGMMAAETARWTEIIFADLQRMSGRLARERGYDMVLSIDFQLPDERDTISDRIFRRRIIHHRPELDITDDVVAALNEAYTKLPRVKMIDIDPTTLPGGAP